MKTEIQSNGLITTGPDSCAGYIFNFTGHGAFDPSGKLKVGDLELTQEQIGRHNQVLTDAEYAAMKSSGRGVLYLFRSGDDLYVGTWASKPPMRCWCFDISHSRNNFGAQRTDVHFNYAGSRWHGVNIGDNDIVRVKRCKS